LGGQSLIVLARRRERTVDLRFDQDVVGAADHDEVFDVVAPDQDELALSIETERVDEAQPRLARPPSRDAQPMREHQPIDDRQDHQRSDSAGSQESDLNDAVVGERKLV
jgi:hypothetical protein